MHGAAQVFELLEEDWNHLTALQIKTVLDSSVILCYNETVNLW